MARSAPAYASPSALRWARESIGLSIEDAAEKLGVTEEALSKAETGVDRLSLRKVEAAAKVYQRPLAALFLLEPPREERPEGQFRRLRDAPSLPWPPEMFALYRRIRTRQDEAVELYELLDLEPPWTQADIPSHENPEISAQYFRSGSVALDDQLSWRDRSGFRPLRAWVDAVESLGVFVMQDGTMDLGVMRGFASTHPQVPAVVVNTDDDPRSRAFTVVHEFGHLIHPSASGPESSPEAWCNAFAAEVIMPGDEFGSMFTGVADAGGDLLERVDAAAIAFGVTPHAAAVRLRRLGAISEPELTILEERIAERAHERPRRQGGNYYRNMVARLGPGFVQLVFEALDRQAVTYPAAAGLLGVKVNNFEKLRKTTLDRVGIA